MRVLISGGGTGGHVYPALAVAEALKETYPDVGILYVGRPEGMEKDIATHAGLPYRGIEAGPIKGATPWTLMQSLARLWRGYRQSHKLLVEWPAHVVFVTGAYVPVPVSLAAWRRGIPVMVYLPDREPGWAVRFLRYFATSIAVSFDPVRASFPKGKAWVSGYPIRAELLTADRTEGYRTLNLDPSLKTLLIMGGSQGAHSINQVAMAELSDLLARYQVIHICGQLDWPQVSKIADGLTGQARARYRPYAYLEEMAAAMAVADLVVSRAGAATLAEWPAMGLPSILVPYVYSGGHQAANADFMVAHGAAIRIDENELMMRLRQTVIDLLEDEWTLKKMSEKAQALSRPDAAGKLATELGRLAHSTGGRAK